MSFVFRVPTFAKATTDKLCPALLMLVLLCSPVFADSKDDSLRPLEDDTASQPESAAKDSPGETATRTELEEEYRKALEERLAEERESYEASLTSLWLANAAVWACLFGFIIMQAVSAKKRGAEIARLKAKD